MLHCRRLGCAETWQTDAATLFAVLGDRGNGDSADRGRVHALDLLNTAWCLLMQAPEHQLVLRRPSHPGAGRIAEMQSWIQDSVTAVDEAQKTKALLAHSGEIAHVEEIADKIAAVVDSFQMYASMLERFRSADEANRVAPAAAQCGSLAAVAADERVLLNCRAAVRSSMQQLIGVLQTDH